MILVMALWTLSLLTIFAVNLGLSIRQKITLLSRLERRQMLLSIAESGIRKAIAMDRWTLTKAKGENPIFLKQTLFNNPKEFQNVILGSGQFTVCNSFAELPSKFQPKRYGLIDETSKININTADRHMLQRLFMIIGEVKEEQAGKLASAVIDWREYGESEIKGFYSNEYYQNLEYPYQPKKDHFETPDELLLVEGMTEGLFTKIKDFITVYGNGQVNINTVSPVVLTVLGLPATLSDQFVKLRQGGDGQEASADDVYVSSIADFMGRLKQMGGLTSEEASQLAGLINSGIFSTQSDYAMMKSRASGNNFKETRDIVCVFERKSGKIVYWKES